MTKFKKDSIGVVLAVVGILMFSAKAVLVKLAYTYEVKSTHILLLRMLFSLPFYLVIAIFKKNNLNSIKTSKDYVYLIIMGFTGYYLSSLFDFEGLRYIKAGLERIILFIYPTLVILISFIFLGKKIPKVKIYSIILTYLGIFMAFWYEPKFEGQNLTLGTILIFFSALTYAIYLIGSSQLIPKFGVFIFTSYAMIVSCCCVFIHYFIVDNGDFLSYEINVYIIAFLMAVFCTIIPSYLVSAAIQRLGASTFAIFGSLGPFSTIFLAFIFLGESLNYLQFIGAIIVIFGVYLVGKKK